MGLPNAPESVEKAIDASSNGSLSDVLRIESEFDRVVDWGSADRQREKRNWDLYFGVDLGQYTEDDKARAILEGRELSTFNVITQKVDSLAGYILKNQFDSDFIPVEGEEGLTTRVLKSLWLSDKDMMDWDHSYAKLVQGGLIYQAVEEMYVDKRFHPLGNIAFRCHLPGHVIFDPRWKTDTGRDCQVAWVVSYLTASQILELYPNAKASLVLQQEIERTKNIGEFYDSSDDKSVTPIFDVSNTQPGDNYYRVIRKFEMTTEDVTIEYDETTGKDLPAGGDYAAKLAFLNSTNPKWEPPTETSEGTIRKRQDKRRVCIVTAVCSQIDREAPLQRLPSPIQIGRLPLFGWSALRANGKCRGNVDLMADLQMKINYREELITCIIETEACGALLADPMLFNDTKELKDAFERDKNQPHKTIWTAPGAMLKGLEPSPIRKSTLPQDARDQLQRMWEYADRISKAPAVFDARSEKSGESGYLFAQKARVAEQQSYTLFISLQRHQQEKAEAYLEQVRIQYTIAGVEREFSIPVGTKKERLVLNQKTKVTVAGVEIGKILNDLSTMPRHKVVITESPVSTTNRLITRAMAAELLRVLPPDAFGTRQVFTSAMVKSLDTFDAKDQEKLLKFRELEEGGAELMLKNNLMKMEMENITLEMNLSDMKKRLAAQKKMAMAPVPPAAAIPAEPAGSPAVAAPPIEGGSVTGSPDSLEGGPVSPEKSEAYSGGGPTAGAAPAPEVPAMPIPPDSGVAPVSPAPAPASELQPQQQSAQAIADKVAQETGGKVSISFSSKPPEQ